MRQVGTVIYTARTHTVAGRESGVSRSSDGRLDVKFASPGSARIGTNPEQLFAAGWSASFASVIGLVAQKMKITLLANPAVDAEVDLILADDGYVLRARLSISLPGLDGEVARILIEEAHRTCPYSKATRGNTDVAISLT